MVTIDTNVAFYALDEDGPKSSTAKALLRSVDFLSVQVLNEYANAARRKLRRSWPDIAHDLELIFAAVPRIHAVDFLAHHEALRIVGRYEISFYDALIVAVALENGATTLYSEDMQHGLVVNGKLTIANPFV